MIQNTANFFQSNWETLIPILFSIIALIISIRTEIRTIPTLDVTFEDKLFITNTILTQSNKFQTPNGFYGAYLKVVNPSVMDIAFFDLIAVNADNPSQSYRIFTQLILDGQKTNQLRYIDGIEEANLNAPFSNYGIFTAHSYSRYEIIFDPSEEIPKEVLIRFKVSIKSRKRVPYSSARRKFKYFKAIYNLESKERIDYREN